MINATVFWTSCAFGVALAIFMWRSINVDKFKKANSIQELIYKPFVSVCTGLAVILAILPIAIKNSTLNLTFDALKISISAWLVLPPLFFMIEHFYFGLYMKDDEYSKFKDGQQVSSKFWAGISVALVFYFFK